MRFTIPAQQLIPPRATSVRLELSQALATEFAPRGFAIDVAAAGRAGFEMLGRIDPARLLP
jgi:hypothetical protein